MRGSSPRMTSWLQLPSTLLCSVRWLVRSLYFPVFLQIRNLPSPVSRSQARTPPRSRGASAPEFLHPCFTHPESRGGRSAEKRSGARRNTRGACHLASKTRVNALSPRHARRLARRLASHNAGRSPLGAPPWRFWASGPRFSHRHPPLLTLQRASDRAQRAPRSQVVMPGGRGPEPPEANGYKPPAAGRHSPLRLQDVSGRRPSMSEDANL